MTEKEKEKLLEELKTSFYYYRRVDDPDNKYAQYIFPIPSDLNFSNDIFKKRKLMDLLDFLRFLLTLGKGYKLEQTKRKNERHCSIYKDGIMQYSAIYYIDFGTVLLKYMNKNNPHNLYTTIGGYQIYVIKKVKQ